MEMKKMIKKGKKLVKKVAKSKTGKEFIIKEKVLAAEMMQDAAKKIKEKATKKK